MNQQIHPRSVISRARDLIPPRALAPREARGVLERQAGRILKLLDIDGPPVPMFELLANLPGIVAESCEGLRVSGRTQWNGDHWLIQVAADEPHVRQRSSLAHELAHIVLHPVADLALPSHGNRTAEARLETACEYFAACLLMPRPWIKRAYFQSGIQDVPSLARLFGVSWTAMNIRLEQLGFIARADAGRAA